MKLIVTNLVALVFLWCINVEVASRHLHSNAQTQKLKTRCPKMDKVINVGIPHVGEEIFKSLKSDDLIECLEVSQTWKVLAENVLLTKWKGRLLRACKTGKEEIVELLLENCTSEEIKINVKDANGWTPLDWACWNGHAAVVKLFLERYDFEEIWLNAIEKDGITPFMLACKKGRTDVVKLLLECSVPQIDFNIRDRYLGKTAFILACEYGRTQVVKLLLDNNKYIDFDVRDNVLRYNGFMHACKKGRKNVVQAIVNAIKSGKNIHLKLNEIKEMVERYPCLSFLPQKRRHRYSTTCIMIIGHLEKASMINQAPRGNLWSAVPLPYPSTFEWQF